MTLPRKVLIAPSVLSADFARLGEEVRAVEAAGADWIHLDVRDGHFVPNLTIGPGVVAAVNKITSLVLDVHLMIDNPEDFLEEFVRAGADYLVVHQEGQPHLHRLVSRIRELGAKAGVALNPSTPLTTIEDRLLDQLLEPLPPQHYHFLIVLRQQLEEHKFHCIDQAAAELKFFPETSGTVQLAGIPLTKLIPVEKTIFIASKETVALGKSPTAASTV